MIVTEHTLIDCRDYTADNACVARRVVEGPGASWMEAPDLEMTRGLSPRDLRSILG